jgi:hypothetical protein
LALALANHLELELELYDPCFNKLDCAILAALPIATVGKRLADLKIDKPTVFFLPHCPKALYEELVRVNWTRLNDVILVGNDLQSYLDHDIGARFRTECPAMHVALSTKSIVSFALPQHSQMVSAFNELAVQTFQRLVLPLLWSCSLSSAAVCL